ncbi:MAG: DNA-3-methyladenine glycosylase [Saprospiraceae bacterium]|nr:DNA-3-methyladenine glycosylase [Saprospiraceae bacterium]
MRRLLPPSWYGDRDVVRLARALLGKELLTSFNGVQTSGLIMETEAYRGPEDRASHAWNGRRTARTEVMFAQGGVAYVYQCYGIHHLFNVVTGPAGIPHAVLVRAILADKGVEVMLQRRGLTGPKPRWLSGPGSVGRALGLHARHSGMALWDRDSPVQVHDRGLVVGDEEIVAGPRVGIDYAGADAALPWRFVWRASSLP